MIDGIDGALDRWLRAVTSQGPETRQRFDEVRERYSKLWHEGNLAGAEMHTLIADWCSWLRLVDISPEGDDSCLALKKTECWKLIQRELAGIDCDPKAIALVRLFDKECGGRSEPPSPFKSRRPKHPSSV
jgi:hypothetical protein